MKENKNVNKKIDNKYKNSTWTYLYIVFGATLFLSSIIISILSKENIKYLIQPFFLGTIFLLFGIYLKLVKKRKKFIWKTTPLSLKIILIYLSTLMILNIATLSKNIYEKSFFFGINIYPPYSVIVNLINLILISIIIFLIYEKQGWKTIIGIQIYNLLNSLYGIIYTIITPIEKIFFQASVVKSQAELQLINQNIVIFKSIMLLPMIIIMLITLIILYFVHKNKTYFVE